MSEDEKDGCLSLSPEETSVEQTGFLSSSLQWWLERSSSYSELVTEDMKTITANLWSLNRRLIPRQSGDVIDSKSMSDLFDHVLAPLLRLLDDIIQEDDGEREEARYNSGSFLWALSITNHCCASLMKSQLLSVSEDEMIAESIFDDYVRISLGITLSLIQRGLNIDKSSLLVSDVISNKQEIPRKRRRRNPQHRSMSPCLDTGCFEALLAQKCVDSSSVLKSAPALGSLTVSMIAIDTLLSFIIPLLNQHSKSITDGLNRATLISCVSYFRWCSQCCRNYTELTLPYLSLSRCISAIMEVIPRLVNAKDSATKTQSNKDSKMKMTKRLDDRDGGLSTLSIHESLLHCLESISDVCQMAVNEGISSIRNWTMISKSLGMLSVLTQEFKVSLRNETIQVILTLMNHSSLIIDGNHHQKSTKDDDYNRDQQTVEINGINVCINYAQISKENRQQMVDHCTVDGLPFVCFCLTRYLKSYQSSNQAIKDSGDGSEHTTTQSSSISVRSAAKMGYDKIVSFHYGLLMALLCQEGHIAGQLSKAMELITKGKVRVPYLLLSNTLREFAVFYQSVLIQKDTHNNDVTLPLIQASLQICITRHQLYLNQQT